MDINSANRNCCALRLTHTSGANTRLASNERMEFLGDSVLASRLLRTTLRSLPRIPGRGNDEGEVRSRQPTHLRKISKKLRLGDFLFLGKGMNGHYEVPENLLADVFESLVAAIYLDGGLEPAKEFILKDLDAEIEHAADGGHGNYKSVLQQVAQRQFGDTPKYCVLDEQGPDHNKCFKISAEIARHRYRPAWGANKKDAEQRAAMNALADIQGEPIPYPSDY